MRKNIRVFRSNTQINYENFNLNSIEIKYMWK